MSQHPLNLVFRFLLEISALISLIIWGTGLQDGIAGIAAGIVAALVFAVTWAVFAVRGDPSRSGRTVVNVPGPVRLMLELFLFAAAAGALFFSGHRTAGYVFTGLLLLHHIISYDRILWLLRRR